MLQPYSKYTSNINSNICLDYQLVLQTITYTAGMPGPKGQSKYRPQQNPSATCRSDACTSAPAVYCTIALNYLLMHTQSLSSSLLLLSE